MDRSVRGHLEQNTLQTRGIERVANTKSAAKRAKQAEVRRQHNVALKSRMRTAIKKVVTAIEAGDAATAAETYRVAVPEIDSVTGKGLIQKNKAARHKSRLNKAVKNLSASA
jgi:small subunit ribosomal protein S20